MTIKKPAPIVVAPLPPLPSILKREPPSYDTAPMTREEKRSALEMRKQLQVIEQTRRITTIGQRAVADIVLSATSVYVETVERMEAVVNASAHAKEVQEDIDYMFKRNRQLASVYIEMVSDQGAGLIAAMVARGTYIDRIPARSGLFRRRNDEY
jgi:hypothetical protein